MAEFKALGIGEIVHEGQQKNHCRPMPSAASSHNKKKKKQL